MELKELTKSDFQIWLTMRRTVLKEVFGIADGDLLNRIMQENSRYFTEQEIGKTHIALVVYENGSIIGCGDMCVHSELPSPDNLSGKCGYLMNIYVAPEYRRHKVGQAIIKRLLSKAQELNITKIYLETTEQARPFYMGLGFKSIDNYLISGV